MLSSLPQYHHFVTLAKRIVYPHGEPYRFDGQTLRFVPGTRPIRLKYASSANWIARYDALQILWLRDHLADGDTAIDIGAHVGIYSVLMAARCGRGGRVVAFEPDPHSRKVIARNVALNPQLRAPEIEASACSDRAGVASFFTGHGDARSALIPAGIPNPEAIQVQLVGLDEYLAARGLAPQAVKIDAEGAEVRILKGATKLLTSKAAILCELHPYAWKDFGNSFDELTEIVARSGRWMRYLDSTQTLRGMPHYGMVQLELQS